jgi:hypothetical protein
VKNSLRDIKVEHDSLELVMPRGYCRRDIDYGSYTIPLKVDTIIIDLDYEYTVDDSVINVDTVLVMKKTDSKHSGILDW